MRYISAHSVGTCIAKRLHNQVGYYDKRYWLTADALFIMKSMKYGARLKNINNIMGEFRNLGETNKYTISALCGNLRIQIEDLGWNPLISIIYFNLKVAKYYLKKIFKQL